MPTSCSTRRQAISTKSEPAQAPRTKGALTRLLRLHFWPHRNWFIAGTAFALLTAACGVGYGGMLAYVGNALQCQIEGAGSDTCASVASYAASIGLTSSRGWI